MARTDHHRLLVPGLVAIGMLVSFVGGLGAPLLPLLAEEYDRSLADAQWALTISLLVGAAVTPVMGRLGDGPHRRPVIRGALAMLVVGSLLCAAADGFALLVVGRGIQGVGFGLMPLAMTVARDHLTGDRSAPTIALLSVTTAVGAGVGFPIGGYWAQTFGVHAAFLLVAILALATLALTWVTIPGRPAGRGRPLDWRGSILLAVPVSLLVIALARAPIWGATSPALWSFLLASAVGLAVWVRVELRSSHPLVDLRSFSRPGVFTAHTTALLAGGGMYMLLTLMLSYVQVPTGTGYGMGRSTTAAGMLLVPFSICSLLAGRVRSRIRRIWGEDRVMPVGCLVYLGATAAFLLGRDSMTTLVVVSAGSGLGLGLILSSIPRLIIDAVDDDEIGSGLGFNQVLRTIGASVGSGLIGAVMAVHTRPGAVFPTNAGYTWSVATVVVVWLMILLVVAAPRLRGKPRVALSGASGRRPTGRAGRTADHRRVGTRRPAVPADRGEDDRTRTQPKAS